MASAADVVRAAQAEKSEIGGRSLTNSASGNKYCAWYPMDGYWCAMFVSYVMNKAGVPTSVVPKYAYCPDCVSFAKSQGRLYSKSQITSGKYTPRPGDVFFRSGDHTGIIVSISGGEFTTIEGNTGGNGPGKRTVASHTFSFSSDKYTHVFNPDYPDKSSVNSGYTSGTEEYMYSENSYDNEKEPTVVWNNRVAENVHARLQGTDTIAPTNGLELYANGNKITNIVGNLAWKNSIYELSTTMSFETPKPIGAYMSDLIYAPVVGDIIQQVTNEEIFRGVIIKVDDGDRFINKYSVVDLGWYLNKTKQTYQFKNITASDAIKELCADLSVNIVMLSELTENINEIYFDKTISDILTDILKHCSGDYNYDFVPEGLRIYKIGDLVAYPEFRIAANIPQRYSVDFRGEVSHNLSIENMKNSIKITSEKDSVYTELKVLQSRELIDKYGFLQEIIKLDPEKENADMAAENALKEYGKVGESFSFTIIEKYDSYTRAGEVISVGGVNYVIESTDHSFKGGQHYNKLELRRI